MSEIIFYFFPSLENILKDTLSDFSRPLIFVFDLIFIFIFIKFTIWFGNKIIGLNIKRLLKRRIDDNKAETVSTVSKSIFRYIVYFIGIIMFLNLMNLGGTVSSLLATAGIGGLAIGFGAQSLIKDIISGIFLLFENQISVGDYVTVAGVTGTIEEIQLRITKVRAFEGQVNIIPNGEIKIVTNYSKGTNKAIIDVPVPLEQDISSVTMILNKAMEKLDKENDAMIAKPEVVGAVKIGDFSIVLRIVADCRSMEHFSVEREMRKAVIEAFDKEGISFPYNKTIILNHN